MSLETVSVQCPYCWEVIEIDVEPQEDPQRFIQDCSVCCRPIQFDVEPDESGGMDVQATRSD